MDESDFSDFKNGSCSSPVEHLVEAQGCKEFNSPPSHMEQTQILPYPINDITWTMLWSEELLDLADQVAQGYGVVKTDEEIEEWAERLSKKMAQLTD